MSSASDNPQAGQGRPLPKKESDLFKSVVKHYEHKQYKKGIKCSDTILKRFPNHGETLCMKGLTLNCMGKKDEAHSLVKKGLMNDMRSHVCWHVYGLLHRSDRNYNEAIKAYKQALRIDSENLQILRDLSLLQIQMRDLNGFTVTRNNILTLKPNQKINWLSFALARHLTGDLRGAVFVIDSYLGTLSEGSQELERGFESSELAMYRNRILSEIPDTGIKEALDHLEVCKEVVVDESSWLKAKARYQLELGLFNDASETYLSTFRRGLTEDYQVHAGYMCARLELDWETCEAALKLRGTDTVATMAPLSAKQRQNLLGEYRGNLLALAPKSQAVRRIPLTLLQGEELQEAVDCYCRQKLSKGVPSLGSDLSALFLTEVDGKYVRADDPVDVRSHHIFVMIVELVEGYISSLSKGSKFSGPDTKEEPPSTILWTWYLRALLHELCGEYTEAVALTDKCLEHTPTAVDVFELKARLLKAGGDISAAADCLDMGRELDKQDRYINNQTTKYMLQADRESIARDRISLFTRHEGNPEQNLFDMQCAWYELEVADCHLRKGDYGRSLKKYMAVEKHFDDFHEDQFDFHAYCVRKVTLRAYTDVLKFEDKIWGQEYYCRAAEGIIRIYLHLFDHPPKTDKEKEPDYSSMTPAERKKAKNMARKKKKAAEKKAAEEAAKKTEEVAKKRATADTNGQKKKGKDGGTPAMVDDDPAGEALLKRNPLEEAKRYVAMLAKNAPNLVSTWILQYEVAIRRGKLLMAMQALFKARTLDPAGSDLFARTVDLAQKLPGRVEKGHPAAEEILSNELATLLGGMSLSDFVVDAATKAKSDRLTSLPHRVAIAGALLSTKSCTVGAAADLIIVEGLEGRMVTVETCRSALQFLTSLGDEGLDAKNKWISSVKERYPLLSNFQ